MKFISNSFPLLILLGFSLFAILSFFSPGFFIIHDNTQIQRTFEMAKALDDGMFPVRWVSDLGYGYGYPIFNFYAPLFYYISGLFTIFGFTALVSTKITAVLAILLSSFSMYLLTREFWGKWGAVLSSILYTYAPFHAVDIFVRGDFAELLAYGFIPLPILGIYRLYSERSKGLWFWTVFTAITFSAIVISHNLTALMVAPFLLVEVVILSIIYFKKEKNFSIHIFYSLFLGLLLSSFYFLPALIELKFTDVFSVIGGGSDFKDHFVCILQFWYSPWGFAGSAPGCLDGISFEIGKLHLASVLIGGVGLLFIKRQIKHFFALLLALLLFIFSIFMMTEYSRVIWEAITPMKFFQFPWRFLILSSFTSSFIAGFLIWAIQKKFDKKRSVFILMIILSIISVIYYQKFFYPENISLDPSSNYTNEKSLKWSTSKISDEYMPSDFPTPTSEEEVVKEKIVISEGSGKINYLVDKTARLEAMINVSRDSKISINIASFPAWSLYINGKKTKADVVSGKYSLDLKRGEYKILVIFEQTPVEKASNFLSLSGIALLFAGIITTHRKNNGK